MSESTFLIGGSGFVGSAVRDLALRSGAPLQVSSRAELDVSRPETISLKGHRTVIHAAGVAHLNRPTERMEAAMWRINVDGTRNVVRAANRDGVRHVVIVSSVSVHAGEGAYAESNIAAERAAIDEAGVFVALTILRVATVYGEGDRGNVLRLIRAIDRGRFLWIGDGQNRKTLIHRDDAAAAILAAASAPAVGRTVFDVAAPPVRIAEVVDAITASLGRSVPRFRIDARVAVAGARLVSAATFGSARGRSLVRSVDKWMHDDAYDGLAFADRYGVHSTVPLAHGIAREVAWYRASGGSAESRPALDARGQKK